MLGVRCDVVIFKLTDGAQSINKEVYDRINPNIFQVNNY